MSTTKASASTKAVKKEIVPDSILKKRKTNQAIAKRRAKSLVQQRLKRKKARRVITTRAAKYRKEYHGEELSLIKQRREAKVTGNIFVEPQAKLAIVTRIRGINGVPPKTRKILQLLRLRQLNNAVLVRINQATINMLRLVEPFIAYGYPNLKTVRILVYKRGYGKVNGQRIPLVDNDLIAKTLGRYGIISTEDLIHEIYTVGKHFKQAANFLWPFKLNSPRGGFVNKLIHFNEGGDAGNRGDKINALIRRMA